MGDLTGKSIYGFGDSLIAGHLLKVGILDYVTSVNKMRYTNYAVNGATVIPGTADRLPGIADVGDIALQIAQASIEVPDYICVNGMTNDAFMLIAESYLGKISDTYDGGYDLSTFTGAFENICYQLRCKYMESKLIYITPHKMPVRSIAAQQTLYARVKEVCFKWSIPVVDVYGCGEINTRIDAMRDRYSYYSDRMTTGGDGMHLNPDGYRIWYAPMIETELMKYCMD